MAAAGSWVEPAAAARWLYRFGTVPRGPDIDRDFGPDDDPMAVLGLTKGARVRRLLEMAYEADSFRGWYSFARTPGQEQAITACKLYVSPRPETLSEAFPIITKQFAQSEVRSFKVGRGIEGLLRPDKIVAYFADYTHMEYVAKALSKSLRGCPAQGVPFTAELGGDGLISTGVDPPIGALAASWRSWITKQLAESLTAPLADESKDRVAVALADIRMAGIDPDRWIPTTNDFWKLSLP